MPEYRRVLVPGGTYFFTVVTYQRRKVFINSAERLLLQEVWNDVSLRHPFRTIAFCILPDHFHLIMTLPDHDANYSMRIREIKRQYSIRYSGSHTTKICQSRIKRNESDVWQRRFWEHYIRDEDDLKQHVEYIHYNPVKHGLVNCAFEWESSSFHALVDEGFYEIGWGESLKPSVGKSFGE